MARFGTLTLVAAAGIAAGLGSMAQGQVVVGGGGGGGQVIVGQPSGGGASGGRVVKSKMDPQAAAEMRQKATASKIARYAKVLNLDEAQTEAAKALYDAYQKETSAASKKMSEAMKSAQDDMNDGDHAAFEKKLSATMDGHRASSKKLTDQFLDDMKSLLRSDQAERWGSFERFRRRERFLQSMVSIGGGAVGGSSVDLFPLVEKVKIPADVRAKVDEVLGMYEVDIDRPLKEREQNTDVDEVKMGAVQRFDGESFAKKQERDRKVDMAIREVNGKYVRQIAALLPEDLGKQFSEAYQAKAYRSIYKESNVSKKLGAAQKVENLSADQITRLRALQEQYRRDAKAANDRWAAAQYKAETAGRPTGGGMLVLGPGDSGGEKIDPDFAEARSNRRAVDDAARKQLETILTPEQLADLPTDQGNGMFAGRRIEMFGDDTGHDMVFVTDLDMDDDFVPPEGGATMIIRTVEVGGPGHGGGDQTTPKPKAD